jgi:hypothetical protein
VPVTSLEIAKGTVMNRVLLGLAVTAGLAVLPSFGSQGEGSMEPAYAHVDAELYVATRSDAGRVEGLLARADSAAAAMSVVVPQRTAD